MQCIVQIKGLNINYIAMKMFNNKKILFIFACPKLLISCVPKRVVFAKELWTEPETFLYKYILITLVWMEIK